MEIFATIAAVVLVLWLLASMKTSRPDGTLLKTHPYRRPMFYIMPTRSESVVFFERKIDATALQAFVTKSRTELDANLTAVQVSSFTTTEVAPTYSYTAGPPPSMPRPRPPPPPWNSPELRRNPLR